MPGPWTPATRRISLAAAAIIAAGAPLAGCSKNIATGRSQFNYYSTEEEIAIGEQAMPELIRGYGGEVPDDELRAYITRIGDDLAQHTEGDNPDLPWEFTFLDSEVINAFALPGGKVFISRGLVEQMDNEAQLAGVLGHEIGHVTAQHADEAMGRRLVLAGVAIGAGVAASTSDSDWAGIAAGAAVSGTGVFLLSYDRNQELEADRLGMRYMMRAGYDPAGQLQVMEILERAAGTGSPPEFLSTHPAPTTRIRKIRSRLDDELAYTQDNPEYRLHAERFQRDFIPRLRTLPPPSQQVGAIDWDQPHTWCAVCASHHGH